MIQPLRDHLLIKVPKAGDKVLDSGIILRNNRQDQLIGEVIALGEGRILANGTRLAPTVSVGAKIIFYDYAGVRVETGLDDAEYLLIKENDVLATIE